MKKIDKIFLIPIALLGLFLLSPLKTMAIGQVTDPIEIKNAMREKSYDETITIVNTESAKSFIQLSSAGAMSDWVKFYKTAQDTENINEVEVLPKSKIDIIARFTIPEGAPNGKYQGYISVLRQAADFISDTKDSGNAVAQKIDREVTVEVNDIENIIFEASLIPEKYDLTQGDLLKIRVIYDNRGNIEINPQINLKIKQEEDVMYSAIFPYPEKTIKTSPYSLLEIPSLEIPTSNLKTGKYKAIFLISQGEKYSTEKEFTFSIGMVKFANANNISDSSTQKSLLPISIKNLLLITATLVLLLTIKLKFKDRSKKNRYKI